MWNRAKKRFDAGAPSPSPISNDASPTANLALFEQEIAQDPTTFPSSAPPNPAVRLHLCERTHHFRTSNREGQDGDLNLAHLGTRRSERLAQDDHATEETAAGGGEGRSCFAAASRSAGEKSDAQEDRTSHNERGARRGYRALLPW